MFKSLIGMVRKKTRNPMLTYIEFLEQLKITVIKYSGRWRQIDSETSIDHTVLFELQRKTIQSPK
jgi:hypothetical protein